MNWGAIKWRVALKWFFFGYFQAFSDDSGDFILRKLKVLTRIRELSINKLVVMLKITEI
jgi:hypothetical protein